jgi:hypothetical protein
MTITTVNSFAKSTGSAANKKTGEMAGKLLGKMAEGLEAMEAIGQLAKAKVNNFMELAIKAAHVAKQTLEAAATKPFATPDLEFNTGLNVPTLGMGGTKQRRVQAKKKTE